MGRTRTELIAVIGFIFCVGTPLANASSLEEGLIAWWRMELKVGSTIPDASGNGHDLTVNGSPTFEGSVVTFNDDGTLEAAHSDALGLLGDWTVSYWVRQDSYDHSPFADTGNGWMNKHRDFHDAEGGWYINSSDSSEVVNVSIYGSPNCSHTTQNGLGLGAWHRLTTTFDSGTYMLRIYFDSNLEYEADIGCGMIDNSYPVLIGGQVELDLNRRPISKGAMSDIRIYDRTLSDSEVAELFAMGSPEELEWLPATSMQEPRTGPAVALGLDGLIYAVGGVNQGFGLTNSTNSAERFDECTGTWEYIASLAEKRALAAGVSDSQGRIWVVGGANKEGGVLQTLDSVERYDPALDSWTTLSGHLNTRRFNHGISIAEDGTIYAFGGFCASAGLCDNVLSSVEKYDPGSDTWDYVAPMNQARTGGGFATDSEGRIYAIGGAGPDQSNFELSTVERYDPALDTWEYVAPLPEGMANPAAFILNGDIYAVGSFYDDCLCYRNTCFIYSIDDNTWRAGPPMFEALGIARGVVSCSETPYVIGGEGPSIAASNRVAMLADESNPNQHCPLGFGCAQPPDSDGDGVLDEEDECPDSDLGPSIVIAECDTGVENEMLDDGCTMADFIMQCADDAVNHGAFVRCVSHLANLWKCQKLINGQQKGAIMSCAGSANLP